MQYSKDELEKLRARWLTTNGKKMIQIIKKSRCFLSPVIYKEKIHSFPGTKDPQLEDKIDLRGIPLSGFDFRSQIKDDDGYREQVAILSNICFEGAILKHCIFQDGKIYDCNFDGADLSHSELKNSTINSCNFEDADLTGLSLHGAKLINCNFTNAETKDIGLSGAIVDEKTTFGKELKSEKEKNHHFASIEYKQIKEMYKNSSHHRLADHYHYKEMVNKRKIGGKSIIYKSLNYFFGDLLCKYGTSFLHVLFWSSVMILGCAFLFTFTESLLFHNTPIKPSLLDSLYFSIVSFTTLGYGDYHAIGSMRYVAAMESFFGAALMSLFTVIVARNIIRD